MNLETCQWDIIIYKISALCWLWEILYESMYMYSICILAWKKPQNNEYKTMKNVLIYAIFGSVLLKSSQLPEKYEGLEIISKQPQDVINIL